MVLNIYLINGLIEYRDIIMLESMHQFIRSGVKKAKTTIVLFIFRYDDLTLEVIHDRSQRNDIYVYHYYIMYSVIIIYIMYEKLSVTL